eukprot:scaffold39135_cov66-Phaeocystis_antarctica.AAC.6
MAVPSGPNATLQAAGRVSTTRREQLAMHSPQPIPCPAGDVDETALALHGSQPHGLPLTTG